MWRQTLTTGFRAAEMMNLCVWDTGRLLFSADYHAAYEFGKHYHDLVVRPSASSQRVI